MGTAYCVRGPANEATIAAISAKRRPCPEYVKYLDSYPSVLLDWDRDISPLHIRSESGELGGFSEFLAASEEVGFPLACFLRTRQIKRPVYIITHGFIFGNNPALHVLRAMDNVHFLCLSDSIYRRLQGEYRFPASRLYVVGYAADLDFFCGNTDAVEEDLVVSAGTASRDYKLLVRSSFSLRVTIEIAADSEWHPQPLNVSPGELPSNVHVGSCRTYEQLRQLYARAALVVVPLQNAVHACGYAVISEAMAMAKPVIATRTESYSDFVVDGITGYYVEVGDDRDLADKLRYLLRNPDVALQMGRAGRKRMEELFSLPAYVKKIHRALCDHPMNVVIQSTGGPGTDQVTWEGEHCTGIPMSSSEVGRPPERG